jgi:putative nucleotidyltransferase with HDIG domain
MAAEPVPSEEPAPDAIDDALAAMGDFADLKSTYLLGHSRAVAELAAAAAGAYGLAENDVILARRAGWVHDVGRVAVSARVWDNAGPLSADDREQVRMHPYYTAQVLSRPQFLQQLSQVASAHHERLDGSGYHRGVTGAGLDVTSRVLAAADLFCAKIEDRPHRAALTREQAAAHLDDEVAAGRLDRPAVDAVLAAAGQSVGRAQSRLTQREIEILTVAARGTSMREIARKLGISPKTVDGHLQRIYPKIGVQTRGGATLYAIEHGLLAGPSGAEVGENSP